MEALDPITANRANWDSRVAHHARGYGLERFEDDPSHLSDVVRFDLPRLGDIAGREVLHLQCHIGTDTLSLARLGARVTGLDFSAPALAVAASLAERCGADIVYVESEVDHAVEALGAGRFDLVYTGIGALCWLPSIQRWAEVVAALLRPGGELFIRDGHPMLAALGDPRDDGLITVEFPYFGNEGVVFTEAYSYVEHEEPLVSPTTVQFNHGLAEIFNALWRAGMEITLFEEHRSVPWNQLGDVMVEVGGGEFELREQPDRLAATFTVRARRLG